MPIPAPSGPEKQNDFISRCMHSIKDDKRPQNQKVAICYTAWKNAKKRKQAKGSDEDPDWDDNCEMGNGFFLG